MQINDKAPDFKLEDQDGTIRTLKDFAGKWLVLYFYPKDDTPGCTVEACSLRDANDELISLGANVVGISKDDTDSHRIHLIVSANLIHADNFSRIWRPPHWPVYIVFKRCFVNW